MGEGVAELVVVSARGRGRDGAAPPAQRGAAAGWREPPRRPPAAPVRAPPRRVGVCDWPTGERGPAAGEAAAEFARAS